MFFGEGAIKQRGSIIGGLLFAWQCRKGGSQKMILYFSATGNGKYIAEQIAEKTDEKCMSIVDCICEDKYCFSNEKIKNSSELEFAVFCIGNVAVFTI